MNIKKKRLIGPLVCMLALSAVLIPRISAMASTGSSASLISGKQIAMDVTYGYGNNAKGGRYIPVEISLENSSEQDFTGTIQILTMESDYDVYRHDYPVTVKAGESLVEKMYLPIGNRADQMYVNLVDEKNEEAARKRVKLNFSLDVPELFIGVLSDTAELYEVWNNVGVDYGMLRTRAVNFDTETFPEEELGLDMIDVLLISNFRIRDLSEAQSKALIEWVRGGGTMILGTGMRVDDTLGRFAPELLEESYEAPTEEMISMGIDYAQESPMDAMLELSCVDFVLSGGNVIQSDDDKILVASASYSKGVIAVAAYDFVDIQEFCHVNPSYIDDLLTGILGENKINQLAESAYSGNSDQYWSIRNMINTGNVKNLPNMGLYVMEIVIYVFLVGAGSYIFLKQRDLTNLYRSGVVILSLLFTLIIYLMGGRTRFKDTFYTYAQFLEISEDTVSETTYMNMRSPQNKPYTAHLTADYSVKPVTRNSYYETGTLPRFTGTEKYRVAIEHQPEQTNVSIQDVEAFEPKYFQLDKVEDNGEAIGFYGEIRVDKGTYQGTVTSRFKERMENCAVLLYDKLICLGDMEPGETKNLEEMPVLQYPRNYSYEVASYLSGETGFEDGDIDDDDYVDAVEKTNLLVFYLDHYMPSYTPNARVVGIQGTGDSGRTFLKTAMAKGHTVVSSTIAVYSSEDEVLYRTALAKEPKVVSGTYDANYNSVYGMEPVTLEYSLGNDVRIERLIFDYVSEEFTGQTGSHLAVFEGNIYFYNHSTGMYDKMDPLKTEYDSEELEAYLSPGNTMTIKYVHESMADYNWDVLLPILNVVGRNTDVKD